MGEGKGGRGGEEEGRGVGGDSNPPQTCLATGLLSLVIYCLYLF